MSIDSEPQQTAPVTPVPSLSERLGLEIKLEMLRAGISGRRLALRLGVSQTWISTRTTGVTPIDVNELQRIADALDIEVGELLSRAAAAKGARRPANGSKIALASPVRTGRSASPSRPPDRRPPSGVQADQRRPKVLRRA